MTGGSEAQMYQAMFLGPIHSMTGKKKMGNMLHKPNRDDLFFLKEKIEEGKIRPLIDRSYSLEEVPEAIRYLEDGHAHGKVVITV
jgi:NADPH:quinone reductase-like Zn-dependent oxidoreductase